ncbi:cobalt-precorrin-6A reductase [Imhoffiella purpurea]|uniref:Cobalt-precorrin-6x reductase n=1 Tax=Imhoffiella purpurea TaxID=1249627 RepID=W9W363_9GAMM|nr:cobalt-precorrin-6A reductase [Imhoffiella purpurea]EXJ17015.1 Cobalt-precorrin-6x reductase [Imhoffiella purpurea]
MKERILILGGTTEAYALAEALSNHEDLRVINSLAGRTSDPRLPAGETRIGGFGGPEGLTEYLREQRIRAVFDATHPFAATMGWNAHQACREAGVPLLRLERPAWMPEEGDRWELIQGWDQGVNALQEGGSRRVLLAVGRQELTPFAGLDGIWFLIRAVTAPDPMPDFPAAELLLARGPFDLDSERILLDDYGIDTIVCKNSGGGATAAKLIAARERGIRVILHQRPSRPAVALATSVEGALNWLEIRREQWRCEREPIRAAG